MNNIALPTPVTTENIRGWFTTSHPCIHVSSDGGRHIMIDGRDQWDNPRLKFDLNRGLHYLDLQGSEDPVLYYHRESIENLDDVLWTAISSQEPGSEEPGIYSLEGVENAHINLSKRGSKAYSEVVGSKFRDVEAVLIALDRRPNDFVRVLSLSSSSEKDAQEEATSFWTWLSTTLTVTWNWLMSVPANLEKWVASHRN